MSICNQAWQSIFLVHRNVCLDVTPIYVHPRGIAGTLAYLTRHEGHSQGDCPSAGLQLQDNCLGQGILACPPAAPGPSSVMVHLPARWRGSV